MSLTDEDKLWLRQQLGQLDLKLDQQFEQIIQKFELINQKFEQIDLKFEYIDRRFEHIDQRFEQMDQKLERVETSLLTEFHKWASPVEARQRTHAAVLRVLEMEALFDRGQEPEGGDKLAPS